MKLGIGELYQPIHPGVHTVWALQAAFIHVVCLAKKIVEVPRQDCPVWGLQLI